MDLCEGLCVGVWMSWCINSRIGQDWCNCLDCRCNCCWDAGELPPEDEDLAQPTPAVAPPSYNAAGTSVPDPVIPRMDKFEYAPAQPMTAKG